MDVNPKGWLLIVPHNEAQALKTRINLNDEEKKSLKTRFILVRHGETSWNLEGRYQGQIDTPLSPVGIKQGKLVAEALKNVPLDAVYTSPLSRSYETAMMCADLHGLKVDKDERLLEINHGKWEGLYATEIEGQYPDLLERWRSTVVDVQMPDGESIEDVRKRGYNVRKNSDGVNIFVIIIWNRRSPTFLNGSIQ